MTRTIHRLSVGLSKEDLRKIETLAAEFGESKASIVQQAVRQYYYTHRITQKLEQLKGGANHDG